jgi:hypothetical protein
MIQTTFDHLLNQPQRDSAYDRLMTAKAEGRRAMEAVAEASGPDFQHRAYEFAVKFFREHGKASAEDCTEAMLAADIRPHDKRAVGHVYKRLVKNNVVTFAGNCARRMGHGAAGGRLYEVVRKCFAGRV